MNQSQDQRRPPHVVVVYSRVGGGHLSAARALSAELERAGASVRLVDAYVEYGRFPTTLFPKLYAHLSRSYPLLWALVFHGSNNRLDPNRILGPFLRSGFARLMHEEQPDLVVSVLPAVNGLLAEAAARVGARVEVVLTDWHSVHHHWVGSGVAHYTVPTESAREDCIHFGAPAPLVEVVGIPVRHDFAETVDRSVVREQRLRKLGLDPARFTVLAMVGAEGSPRALASVRRLLQLEPDIQIIVVCGRNEALRARVAGQPTRLAVRALGFVEDIADLMRGADVLVTKAGGLTLAEAFCCGVPVVVHDVLPGQEAGNLAFALHAGSVAYATRPRQLARIIAGLQADSSQRNALAARGQRLARPHAARDIAQRLLSRLANSVAANPRPG